MRERERYGRYRIPLVFGADDPEVAENVKAAYTRNPLSWNIGAIVGFTASALVGLVALTVLALGVAWVFWLLIGLFP
jgi:hypothetical protein